MILLVKSRAFTLVELQVVIPFIGILASLWLPALARSKAVAKRIHCVGNVRQLSLAAHLYTDDYEDRLPPSFDFSEDGRGMIFGNRQFWRRVALGCLFGSE